ncbi:hypothetical protein ACTA71_006695 [Dictyostelium dimigraforme]
MLAIKANTFIFKRLVIPNTINIIRSSLCYKSSKNIFKREIKPLDEFPIQDILKFKKKGTFNTKKKRNQNSKQKKEGEQPKEEKEESEQSKEEKEESEQSKEEKEENGDNVKIENKEIKDKKSYKERSKGSSNIFKRRGVELIKPEDHEINNVNIVENQFNQETIVESGSSKKTSRQSEEVIIKSNNNNEDDESALEFLKKHRISQSIPKSEKYLKADKIKEDEITRKRLSLNRDNINFGNNKDRNEIFKRRNSQNGAGILPKRIANNIVKNNWMKRQMTDPFVAMAKTNNLISRAAYKIINIDDQIHLFKPGQVVADLGASPGGWSKFIRDRVTNKGLVVSVDTSNIFQLDKDGFICGDFTLADTQTKIINLAKFKSMDTLKFFKNSLIHSDSKLEHLLNIGDIKEYSATGVDPEIIDNINKRMTVTNSVFDVVVSDMAPSYCGLPQVDHSRLINLQKLALIFALKTLKKGGSFICKVSRGGEERKFFKLLESNFISVKSMKPGSSRSESTEIYYIGKNYIGK